MTYNLGRVILCTALVFYGTYIVTSNEVRHNFEKNFENFINISSALAFF